MKDFEIMKKVLASGEVGDIQVQLVTTPRYLVKAGNQKIWLEANKNYETNANSTESWALQRIKESLTTKYMGESFPWIAVDKNSSMRENQSLQLFLKFSEDEFSGTLKAHNLENHIAINSGENQSPEAIAGLELAKQSRIIFNLVGSEPCKDKKGFDRVKRGKRAILWINTLTGDWVGEKTDTCKKEYPPLAHLSPHEISNEELMKAMSFAPCE